MYIYKKFGKRYFDFISALFGLIVLSPIMLIIALFIRCDSKGPILFKQKRIGLNNREFYILKFRTMFIDAPQNIATDELINPSELITRTGAILRKSSLDELPQLINILIGQMSVVGPRPSLWNQYNLIKLRTDSQIQTIKPGLTGLAQINGRDENNDHEKVKWDLIYLQTYSLKVDLKCIISTAKSVLKSDGIIEGKIK